MWGTDANNTWAIGDRGTIFKGSVGGWARRSSGTDKTLLLGVWGSSASDLWVVGEFGTILRLTCPHFVFRRRSSARCWTRRCLWMPQEHPTAANDRELSSVTPERGYVAAQLLTPHATVAPVGASRSRP